MDKKSFKAYSLLLFPIYFVIFFVTGLALTTPMGKIQNIDVLNSTPLFTKSSSQASIVHDCRNIGGVFRSRGEDSYVVFDCSRYNVTAISATLDSTKTDKRLTLYYDLGTSFSESQTVRVNVSENNPLVFSRYGEKIYRIRFDFTYKLKIEKIDFYENGITSYSNPVADRSLLLYIFAISFILSVIVTVIEAKTNAVLQFFGVVKRNAKSILLFIIGMTSAAIFALLISYMFSISLGQMSIYFFTFVFAVLAVIFEILFFSKSAGEKTERLFLSVCLTIGMMMIIITPVGMASWDTDTHYYYSLATTSPTTTCTQADSTIIFVGQNMMISGNLKENEQRYDVLNFQESLVGNKFGFKFKLPNLGSGIALKLAKYFGFSFVHSFMIGKIPILFIYAFACYFAIKKLNSGKMLLSVIALFPTSLLLATNYSHDYWVIAFSFLGISYYYSMLQTPTLAIKKRDIYIMYGALFLACIPKPIYLTLLFIPLFMPASKVDNKFRYYSVRIVLMIVLIGMILIKVKASLTGRGDMRGGVNINPSEQLAGIIANPFGYLSMLAKFLKDYLSIRNMSQYISLLGYLGNGSKSIVFIVLIIILGIIDKNEYDTNSSQLRHKLISVAVLVGTSAMIATALYIDYTPVGLDTINGCQARYLTPLIFPVCYTLGSFKRNIKIPDGLKNTVNTIAFSACCYAALYDIYTTTLTKMM